MNHWNKYVGLGCSFWSQVPCHSLWYFFVLTCCLSTLEFPGFFLPLLFPLWTCWYWPTSIVLPEDSWLLQVWGFQPFRVKLGHELNSSWACNIHKGMSHLGWGWFHSITEDLWEGEPVKEIQVQERFYRQRSAHTLQQHLQDLFLILPVVRKRKGNIDWKTGEEGTLLSLNQRHGFVRFLVLTKRTLAYKSTPPCVIVTALQFILNCTTQTCLQAISATRCKWHG